MDLDAPAVEVTLEMQEEQERMRATAALASFYYMTYQTDEKGLPDALVHELVIGWHNAYIERCRGDEL